MRSMRPPVDVGPCQVRGPLAVTVTGKARVMWEDGVLYVARGSKDVVQVECAAVPREPSRPGQNWVADTAAGEVLFRRRGCRCGYQLGMIAFGTLRDVARYIEGVESGRTPVDAATQPTVSRSLDGPSGPSEDLEQPREEADTP